MKNKVKIFKDFKEIGWAKSEYGAINTVINSCKVHGFDIKSYEIKDFDSLKVIWRGLDYGEDRKG